MKILVLTKGNRIELPEQFLDAGIDPGEVKIVFDIQEFETFVKRPNISHILLDGRLDEPLLNGCVELIEENVSRQETDVYFFDKKPDAQKYFLLEKFEDLKDKDGG